MTVKDKVAMVTGGGQGIGRSFVEALLGAGAKVMICDLGNAQGQKAADELAKKYGTSHVQFLALDVTDYKQFEDCLNKTVKSMGSLDILINNAGIFDETSEKGWEKMIKINFNSVVKGTHLGLKVVTKGGVIINVASVTSLEPFPTLPIYAATKAACSHFTTSYGHKMHTSGTGIKVIGINPGFTDTQILKDIDNTLDSGYKEDHRELMKSSIKTQKLSNMGVGLLQVLEKAESGQMWTIENDEPAKLCTHPA